MQPDFSTENLYPKLIVAGIDEAGRGPIAGPVVAACVILKRNEYEQELFNQINDSKKLTKSKRQKIFLELQEKSLFGVGVVDEKTIDKINILQATKLAMHCAFCDLQKKSRIFPQIILVDGNFTPFAKQNQIQKIIPIVKGDQKSLSIAAASIIAKETRDQIMENLHQKFPQFGFEKHFGYATKFHLEKIRQFGVCESHRLSFEPIKSIVHENS